MGLFSTVSLSSSRWSKTQADVNLISNEPNFQSTICIDRLQTREGVDVHGMLKQAKKLLLFSKIQLAAMGQNEVRTGELDAPAPERFELLTSGLAALPAAPLTLLGRLLMLLTAGVLARL